MTGAGGVLTASARVTILCVWARFLARNKAFEMLEMVYVLVQKRGGKFFQPMGRVSGMGTSCYPP